MYRGLGFLRGLSYHAQSKTLNKLGRFLFQLESPPIESNKFLQDAARESLFQLLKLDADRFADGTYAPQAHDGLDVVKSWLRSPIVTFKSLAIFSRRKNKDWKVSTQDPLYPKYFQRSFHFQENGYQSAESAKLYDAQVELLFAGSANAMRRLALVPLRVALKSHQEITRKFKVLEVACGTGSGTKLLHAELSRSKHPFELWALDLSADYLGHAKKVCADLVSTHFFQADASELPFESHTFDAVSATFLWHELPNDIRKKALQECMRVLRRGGTFISVESLQLGDNPVLDPLLDQFPLEFHEPFFKSYAGQRLEETEGFTTPFHRELGFLSKCLAWRKE